MKNQNDQVIIYDDACPMCTAYTGAFARLGWLSKRIAFSQIPRHILQKIDVDRGRHEIPLHDCQSGQTVYGLDSLFLIIGNRFPKLNPIFRNRFFRFFWKQVYGIITYNRRVIAGSSAPASGMDCAPDRHLGYRWAYIILMLTAASFLFLPSSFHFQGILLLSWGPLTILGLGLPLGLLLRADRLSWVGHWVTILFITALSMSLLPTSAFTSVGAVVLVIYLLWRRWRLV